MYRAMLDTSGDPFFVLDQFGKLQEVLRFRNVRFSGFVVALEGNAYVDDGSATIPVSPGSSLEKPTVGSYVEVFGHLVKDPTLRVYAIAIVTKSDPLEEVRYLLEQVLNHPRTEEHNFLSDSDSSQLIPFELSELADEVVRQIQEDPQGLPMEKIVEICHSSEDAQEVVENLIVKAVIREEKGLYKVC